MRVPSYTLPTLASIPNRFPYLQNIIELTWSSLSLSISRPCFLHSLHMLFLRPDKALTPDLTPSLPFVENLPNRNCSLKVGNFQDYY